ncbi:MAG: winged helix-turn-helix domain-containing protein [Anaerolineae bacterium]|jgi:DNA-binding response OmpR family regulator
MATTESVPLLTDPTGREHPLGAEFTTIGRAVENDIVITSKRVSREHAQVQRQGRRMVLADLGSTNGTFLNGERVMAPVELRDGDGVSIGDVLLTFHDPESTYLETPFPELVVDAVAGIVRLDRQAVALSPKEFALLSYLYERRGQVCSKDDIGNAVWPEYQDAVYDYQIENLVRRLRSRIEPDPANPQLLLTERGRGYKLVIRERVD